MELDDADNADTWNRLNDTALDNTKPGLANSYTSFLMLVSGIQNQPE